jgi:hypothetical protein
VDRADGDSILASAQDAAASWKLPAGIQPFVHAAILEHDVAGQIQEVFRLLRAGSG